jgi:WS/DGAT/MGAT family acyltransferase
MAPADAAWLRMDRPTNLMIITTALWFDEPLDEQALRETIQTRMVDRYPRFRQRVHEGIVGVHWEDDPDFDIDLHLHHLALPEPGDRDVLARVVGELMSEPLDRARPLWMMHLFDGYGDGCAVVVRMHHAIADGIALARVMLELTDGPEGADEPVMPQGPPKQPRLRLPFEAVAREAAGAARLAARETAHTLRHPSHVGELARESVADGRALARFLFAPTERVHPLHAELGVAQRVAWSPPIPLDTVRAVGKGRRATINDVLVACVAGAIRRYLEERDMPTDDVHAMVPFNLRPLDQPLPRDLGNRFGLVLLDLPVATADPLLRLRRSASRMRAIKHSREGPVSYGILGAMGHTLPMVEARAVDLFSSKATMVLTNVPGPRHPVSLAGVPLGGVLGWAPCSGAVGMSVSIFSYAGEVTVGFMVNGRLIEDPEVLVTELQASLEELVAATS